MLLDVVDEPLRARPPWLSTAQPTYIPAAVLVGPAPAAVLVDAAIAALEDLALAALLVDTAPAALEDLALTAMLEDAALLIAAVAATAGLEALSAMLTFL